MSNCETAIYLTTILFMLTYIGLAVGKVPGLYMDRAGIALVGATLMLVTGMLSLEQAVSTDSIDYKTLCLLFGMMVVVGFLRLSGFFQQMTASALRHIRTPVGLLAVTDHAVRRALGVSHQRHRVPDAYAAGAAPGTAAAIRPHPAPDRPGDGGEHRLDRDHHRQPAEHFHRLPLRHLLPAVRRAVAAGRRPRPGVRLSRGRRGLPPQPVLPRTTSGIRPEKCEARHRFGHDRRSGPGRGASRRQYRAQPWLQHKSVAVTLAAVVLFFTGLPLELVALGAAAALLLGRIKPEKVYREIDWSLLVMFTGLFIVVHAFQVHVVAQWGIEGWTWLLQRPVDLLSLVSAGLSNLVSNVPAVLLMEPVLQAMPEASRETAWLALAMSSTLAGNLTVLGSVANLIVVENAQREGVTVSFWEYCKVGVPLTLLTLVLGIAWLQFVHY